MPPKLELAFNEKSSEESVNNFQRIEDRFPELSSKKGIPIVESKVIGQDHIKINNSLNEEIYIYLGEEEWFFRKTQEMKDGVCILFDSIMLVPYQSTEFKTRVAIISLDTPDIIDIECQVNDKGSNFYYGVLNPVMAENNRGRYYKDVEEYIRVRNFIEDHTGVAIEDFHIGLNYYKDLGTVGDIRTGQLETAMQLE